MSWRTKLSGPGTSAWPDKSVWPTAQEVCPPALCGLEGRPIDAELPDRRTQSANLQVAPSPIRQYCGAVRRGVVPLAVCPATLARQLTASQGSELPGRFSVPHGVGTSASAQMTSPLAGSVIEAGKERA